MRNYLPAIIALLAIFAFLMLIEVDDRVRVYDCSIAQWHPDVPNDVKEECRRKILEHLNETRKRNYI